MIKFKVLLPLLACFLFTACQGQKTEVVKEYIGNATPSGGQMQGGTDSGGDNGVEGRNMEDYAINIQEEPAFKQFVLPIIVKLAETNPRFASDMVHITSERTWYKIPVALNTLKAADIGVNFADKDVQQFALQNLKAIWINTSHYDGFPSDESKGRLILHEILMGIRLMKLKGSLDNCYSESALMELDPSKAKDLRKYRESCAMKYSLSGDPTYFPGITKIDLKPSDYDNIRELGVELWNNKGAVSKVELDAWLKVNSFRSY